MEPRSGVSGRIDTIPWGSALFGFAARCLTGVVSLNFGSHELRFDAGIVVAAKAPMTEVDPIRLAVGFGLLEARYQAETRKRITEQPARDDLEIIAEVAELDSDGTQRLRRKILARRAASTFGVEGGGFEVVEDGAATGGQGIDVQPIIYLGALLHANQPRLIRDMEKLGDRFKLRPGAREQLERFGFTEGEGPIVDALAQPRTVSELVAAARPLDAHEALAALYALASCGLCEVSVGDAKRSRVNSKVSFKKKAPPPAVPVPPAEPAPQRVSAVFDLAGALSADLGDEPLFFESAPATVIRLPTAVIVDEPEPIAEHADETPTLSPAELANHAMPAARQAKRTAQLLAFVAVPRGPARKP